MKLPACRLIMALFALPALVAAQARSSIGSIASTPRNLLVWLAGRWHVDMYSQGSASPIASGQRDMHLLADSMKLTWSETVVDGRFQPGAGILGYNAATGAYYVLGGVEHEPSPMILIGRADRSGHTVTFDVASTDTRLSKPGIYVTSELRLIDPDHFEWVAPEGHGRAVFSRIGHS